MKAEQWKMIDRKVVFDHPRIHLVEDTVKLPDGKVASYLRIAPVQTHSVAIIALNEEQEILLQKEYSYPPDRIMWQLPGGGMRTEEDVIVAANRELSEESGLTARSCKIIGSFYVNNRRSDEKQYVVVCSDLQPATGQRDEEEFIESHWIPIAKLPSMIATGEFDNVNLLATLSLWFYLAESNKIS